MPISLGMPWVRASLKTVLILRIEFLFPEMGDIC